MNNILGIVLSYVFVGIIIVSAKFFEKAGKEAKKAKNWARADEIRNILKEKGIVLVDTPEGTIWKKE